MYYHFCGGNISKQNSLRLLSDKKPKHSKIIQQKDTLGTLSYYLLGEYFVVYEFDEFNSLEFGGILTHWIYLFKKSCHYL